MKVWVFQCINALIVLGSIVMVITESLLHGLFNDINYSPTGALQYYFSNIKQDPISEILVVDSNTACPQDYTYQSIGKWLGSKNICSKLTGDFLGQCTPGMEEIPQVEIKSWKGKKFCLKRITNYYYKNQSQNESCQLQYQECFKGMCVHSSEKCPISEIHSQINFPHSNQTSYESLQLTPDAQILYARSPQFPPISSIEYSQRQVNPCWANGWLPKDPNHYKRMNSFNGCGKPGTDNETQSLDRQATLDLFLANGMERNIRKLKGYEKSLYEEDSFLVSRRKLDINPAKKCRVPDENVFPQGILDVIWKLKYRRNNLVAMNVFNYFGMLPITFLMCCLAKESNFKWFYSVYYLYMIPIFLHLMIFLSFFSAAQDIYSEMKLLQRQTSPDLFSPDCLVDQHHQEVIGNHTKAIDRIVGAAPTMVSIQFSILTLRICILIMLICFCCWGIKNVKSYEENSSLSNRRSRYHLPVTEQTQPNEVPSNQV